MKGNNELLKRISNLISEDSTILSGYNTSIENASSDKVKAESEKKSFEGEIKNIQGDIDDISKVSELGERFANLDVYKSGLEKLGEACDYINKLQDELERIPEHIEHLENKIKELNEKSNKCEKTIKDAEDELSKLDVELSDAKRYQSNLVDLIKLAKTGDINKTREEVVETLTHVGFNEQDATNAAKVILFPEDELIPFFDNKAKKEEPKVEEPKIEEQTVEEEPVVDNVEEEKEEITLEPVVEEPEETAPEIEEEVEITPEEVVNTPEEVKEESNNNANENELSKILADSGLDITKFNDDGISLLNSVLEENITKNVDFILSKNIDKEFIYQYPNVLSDTELEDKYNFITKDLGKTEEDIKINPIILISYSLNDFKKLTDIANKSGINAKLIPIAIYIKGLQSFLQNYMSLKNANINLDDIEIAKFGSVLAINPIEFKESFQTILSYNLTLKKNSGKYAIMALLKNVSELKNDINMLIEIGEEDILKFYPEVLEGNVSDLINRLLFIKKAGIPYKATAHGETVYQSYVLSQEKLEHIVEKKLDLKELNSVADTNKILNNRLQDETIVDALDKMSIDDKLQSLQLDSYETLLNQYNKAIKEVGNAFVIDNMYFSKNRVKENMNYLLTNMDYLDKEKVVLAGLIHNTHLTETEVNKVIKALNIKVGK